MSETRDNELCAKCDFTFAGHVSNTGAIYPCWTPSGRYGEITPRAAPEGETPLYTKRDAEAMVELAVAAREQSIVARLTAERDRLREALNKVADIAYGGGGRLRMIHETADSALALPTDSTGDR